MGLAKRSSFQLQHRRSRIPHDLPPVRVSDVAATPFVPGETEAGHQFGGGSFELRETGEQLATEERCRSSPPPPPPPQQRCRYRCHSWRLNHWQN